MSGPNKRIKTSITSPTPPTHPSYQSHDQTSTSNSLTGLMIESFEAELCENHQLGLQTESQPNEINGGRLIQLTQRDHQVWVDRYDARLLLLGTKEDDEFHSISTRIITPPPQSPTGYSDLASDHEEMFYFDDQERHAITQKKLRRKRDDAQHQRIRLREEEDKLREEEIRLSKIPPADQINLMKRTLNALRSSPSPSLLEIRILTNHGNDIRFSSFLKRDGQYRSYWEHMNSSEASPPSAAEEEADQQKQQADHQSSSLEGLIAHYGDSSSEENEKEEEEEECQSDPQACDAQTYPIISPEEEKDRTDLKSDPDSHLSEPKQPQEEELIEKLDDEQHDHDQKKSVTVVDEIERARRLARVKAWADQRKLKTLSSSVLPS